jgi:ribose-phosphate pyrophosphokinase
VYDDMIRTGGSLVAAARAYRAAGAASVDALTTHAVLPDDALARLVDTGLFGAIVATDSHPRARALEGPALQVHSLAPLLGEALRA